MPIIIVYGVSGSIKDSYLKRVCDELRDVTAKIPKLKITKDQVSVFFPNGRWQTDLHEGIKFHEEIIIFVEGLFEKPERDEKIRRDLALNIGVTAKKLFTGALVEVFVRSFNPQQGFWSSAG